MFGIEWLKPAVLFGSIIFAVIGVIVLWACFVILDKLTPQRLWVEISEKGNLALAIFLGAVAIAIGQIIAAAIHG